MELFSSFEEGRCRLVIGVNGSGKTRLLRVIEKKRKGCNPIFMNYAQLLQKDIKDASELDTIQSSFWDLVYGGNDKESETFLDNISNSRQVFVNIFFIVNNFIFDIKIQP